MLQRRLLVEDVIRNTLSVMEQPGMTQSQLAHELGVSKSGLSNILSGRRGSSSTVISGLMQIFPKETVFTLTEIES